MSPSRVSPNVPPRSTMAGTGASAEESSGRHSVPASVTAGSLVNDIVRSLIVTMLDVNPPRTAGGMDQDGAHRPHDNASGVEWDPPRRTALQRGVRTAGGSRSRNAA